MLGNSEAVSGSAWTALGSCGEVKRIYEGIQRIRCKYLGECGSYMEEYVDYVDVHVG